MTPDPGQATRLVHAGWKQTLTLTASIREFFPTAGEWAQLFRDAGHGAASLMRWQRPKNVDPAYQNGGRWKGFTRAVKAATRSPLPFHETAENPGPAAGFHREQAHALLNQHREEPGPIRQLGRNLGREVRNGWETSLMAFASDEKQLKAHQARQSDWQALKEMNKHLGHGRYYRSGEATGRRFTGPSTGSIDKLYDDLHELRTQNKLTPKALEKIAKRCQEIAQKFPGPHSLSDSALRNLMIDRDELEHCSQAVQALGKIRKHTPLEEIREILNEANEAQFALYEKVHEGTRGYSIVQSRARASERESKRIQKRGQKARENRWKTMDELKGMFRPGQQGPIDESVAAVGAVTAMGSALTDIGGQILRTARLGTISGIGLGFAGRMGKNVMAGAEAGARMIPGVDAILSEIGEIRRDVKEGFASLAKDTKSAVSGRLRNIQQNIAAGVGRTRPRPAPRPQPGRQKDGGIG